MSPKEGDYKLLTSFSYHILSELSSSPTNKNAVCYLCDLYVQLNRTVSLIIILFSIIFANFYFFYFFFSDFLKLEPDLAADNKVSQNITLC